MVIGVASFVAVCAGVVVVSSLHCYAGGPRFNPVFRKVMILSLDQDMMHDEQ